MQVYCATAIAGITGLVLVVMCLSVSVCERVLASVSERADGHTIQLLSVWASANQRGASEYERILTSASECKQDRESSSKF